MQLDRQNLNRIAGMVATEVYSLFEQLSESDKIAGVKSDKSVVTELDYRVQHRLQQLLLEAFPMVAFLGEEMPTQQLQPILTSKTGCWCLDPIDGTSNYAGGVPFFAVSLGFIQNGVTQLAVVIDPVRHECFTALRGAGAWLNGEELNAQTQRMRQHTLAECIAVVDFKRLTSSLATRIVTQPPFRSQRNFGSCALEWCWLAARRFQLYLHGGQKIWDYCAGELIAVEAGCSASTLTGEKVFSLSLDKRAVVAGVSQSLQKEWLDWLCSTQQ